MKSEKIVGFLLRLPQSLHDRMVREAKLHRCSLTAYINGVLSDIPESQDPEIRLQEIDSRLQALGPRLRILQSRLQKLAARLEKMRGDEIRE